MAKKIIKKKQNPSDLRSSPLDRGDTNELSNDTKTLITVICLVTVYPVGLILMFVWMRWNKWLKFLVAFPGIFALVIPFLLIMVVGVVMMRLGGDLINSNEFKEITKEMMISPTEVVKPTEMMVNPTIKIIKE